MVNSRIRHQQFEPDPRGLEARTPRFALFFFAPETLENGPKGSGLDPKTKVFKAKDPKKARRKNTKN